MKIVGVDPPAEKYSPFRIGNWTQIASMHIVEDVLPLPPTTKSLTSTVDLNEAESSTNILAE